MPSQRSSQQSKSPHIIQGNSIAGLSTSRQLKHTTTGSCTTYLGLIADDQMRWNSNNIGQAKSSTGDSQPKLKHDTRPKAKCFQLHIAILFKLLQVLEMLYPLLSSPDKFHIVRNFDAPPLCTYTTNFLCWCWQLLTNRLLVLPMHEIQWILHGDLWTARATQTVKKWQATSWVIGWLSCGKKKLPWYVG